jgi:hypothetical protein
VINIAAIYDLLLVSTVRSFIVVLGMDFLSSAIFVKSDNQGIPDVLPDVLSRKILLRYAEANKYNSELNNRKALKIGLGQMLFLQEL